MIILGISLPVELGVPDPLQRGMSLGGGFAFVYLFAGILFWAVAKLFCLPKSPESYWYAGVFALVHLAACIYFSYNLEILMFGPVVKGLGPIQYNEYRMTVFAAIFLPTLFTGMLAVSARARVQHDKSLNPGLQKFLMKNAVFLIPIITVCAGFLCFAVQPAEIRSLVKARMFYEFDAAEQAIKISESVLEKKDDFAPLHYIMGSAILESSPASYTPADAVFHLQRAVDLVPENPLYLYKLSLALDSEGDSEQAIAIASRAVDLQPKDEFLWQHLGELNLKYHKLEGAVAAYEKAAELDPDNPTLLNNLAYTCLELGKNLPLALELARKSVEILPGFVFNTDTLAWAYYKNKMYPEALETISTIYSDRKEITPEVDFHYAMILYANGLLAEPVKALDKLLARPEVIADFSLNRQISEAKMKMLSEDAEMKENGEGTKSNE
ncbi:MAG: hypothetical protein Kow0029_04770 [Candidatus Rifleibacteriota bacterium]